MKKQILIILIIALVAVSCQKDKTIEEQNKYTISGAIITIPKESSIFNKISTTIINDSISEQNLVVSGVVKAIPNAYAKIASPFAGRITKSFVRLGSKVTAGSPIFEISSSDFYETGKAYYEAKQEYELARKNLKRRQDLFENGVGVQKDLEEAEVNTEIKSKELERAEASLKIFNVNPNELVLGKPLIVRSPISGTVIDNNIVIGQYLKEDAEPIASVAEIGKVWVAAQVKEKDINFISATEAVEIFTAGNPDSSISGKIYHIGEVLDEGTRSVQVIVECDNPNLSIKPGMYVSVKFSDKSQKCIAIPSKAIYRNGDSSFVFVKVAEGKFTRKAIKEGTSDGETTFIKEGLISGEEIIFEGGYYLIEAK